MSTKIWALDISKGTDPDFHDHVQSTLTRDRALLLDKRDGINAELTYVEHCSLLGCEFLITIHRTADTYTVGVRRRVAGDFAPLEVRAHTRRTDDWQDDLESLSDLLNYNK